MSCLCFCFSTKTPNMTRTSHLGALLMPLVSKMSMIVAICNILRPASKAPLFLKISRNASFDDVALDRQTNGINSDFDAEFVIRTRWISSERWNFQLSQTPEDCVYLLLGHVHHDVWIQEAAHCSGVTGHSLWDAFAQFDEGCLREYPT